LKNIRLVFLLVALVLVACAPTPPQQDIPLATPSVRLVASETPAPSPSATAIQLPSATPTIPPSPTPTPHPVSIAFLRAGSYLGSDIVIEKELARGGNYRRYYASYLSEGYKIYALLTIPDGEVPEGGFPAIVFNHGYIPPEVYRTTERYIAYVDRLALAGYVVFRIDYRGHDQSEGPASGAYGDPGYAIDVLNALASIKRLPQVNPARIGMWGHSMGGYLTLRAMVVSHEIKAGVIWAGVVGSYPDMIYNWRRSGSFTPSPSSRGAGWRSSWLETYGTPQENPAFWASLSANNYLADLSGPIQLHHGTEDEDVPVSFSVGLDEQIRAAGGQSELYLYEKDNHNISHYFSLAMQRTIDFFDEHLK
jgi:dipeptidyl aminopeptidase/acylaminoacyl peptidase